MNSSSGEGGAGLANQLMTQNMLQGQNDEELNEIDNPEELLEEQDDDEDPQVLEEIEKRQDEIIEEFMELSLNIKHDMREKVLQQYQEKYGEIQG